MQEMENRQTQSTGPWDYVIHCLAGLPRTTPERLEKQRLRDQKLRDLEQNLANSPSNEFLSPLALDKRNWEIKEIEDARKAAGNRLRLQELHHQKQRMSQTNKALQQQELMNLYRQQEIDQAREAEHRRNLQELRRQKERIDQPKEKTEAREAEHQQRMIKIQQHQERVIQSGSSRLGHLCPHYGRQHCDCCA